MHCNLTNYHSHSSYSDGRGDLEDYVLSAIDKGLTVYGFSDHAPVDFNCSWTMKPEKLPLYLDEIDRLKIKYTSRIELLKSLEIDYAPNNRLSIAEQVQLLGLDYIVGSVHFVSLFDNGVPWNIDTGRELFESGLSRIFDNDPRKAVSLFYELTSEMLRILKPDIVGHIDKICMFNQASCYFDESEAWYSSLVEDVLFDVKKSGAVLELNTRGFYKGGGGRFHPSLDLLRRANKLKIPVVVNSDCHSPDEIIFGYVEARNLLKKAGYSEECYFSEGKRMFQKI